MKKIIKICLVAVICCSAFALHSAEIDGSRCIQSEEAVKEAVYGHIDAKGLKALMDAQIPFILLDARGHKWSDGTKIVSAELASYQDSQDELREIIPDLDTLVVVYCYQFTCPLGRYLSDKLVEYGYQNVIEYPGGLREWRDVADYPIVSIE